MDAYALTSCVHARCRNFLSLKSLAPNTLQATAMTMPRFMYKDDQEYDSDDVEAGLFQGHYLLNVRCGISDVVRA